MNEGFIRKLQAMTQLQLVALVDAVEQYWIRELPSSDEPLETKLRQVNLLKCCDFAL